MFQLSYSDHHRVDLPAGHRFPMLKYELIREQLLREGIVSPNQLKKPDLIAPEMILAVHTTQWWDQVNSGCLTKEQERRLGFPMTRQLLTRSHSSASGTWETALNALGDGAAMNLAGGTHHAFADRGEGFCLFNDVGIASRYLLNANLCKRVLVLDLDVHQGNGTASLFQDEDSVFTFSMHGERNYPLPKEQSNLDIALPDGCTDEIYNNFLTVHLGQVMDSFQPDFVFYIAGSDVLATDRLGRLSLTLDGCKQRDQHVIGTCYQSGTPLAIVLGGGYSERFHDIVRAHVLTVELLAEYYG
jgi:acetoin utilization deacetylase AcuC-like enzyme